MAENIQQLLTQQKDMSVKVDRMLKRISDLEEILNKMEETNRKLEVDNVSLRTSLTERDGEVERLRHKIHSLEAHNRSFSVRVNKLKINGDESDPNNVREQLYNTVFLPILQGAAQRGLGVPVPTAEQLIEMAHVLPGKTDAPKPIICRFQSRILKGAIMSHKKDFAPRVRTGAAAAAAREGRPPPMLYPIYEDLTRDTYVKMLELSRDTRVAACWSVGGQLRYRLNSDPTTTVKVKSVFAPISEILG